MTHSWNSIPSPSTGGMFGKGWRFAYEWSISPKDTGGVILRKGSGREIGYDNRYTGPTTPPAWTPQPGFFDKLTWVDPYWLWVEKDTRWTYRFDPVVIGGQPSTGEFRLTSITDTNGNAVTLAYTSGNVIRTITDAVGRATTFTHDGSNRVTRMDAPDGRYATYQYDSAGHLVRTTDLLGTVTTYAYDGSGYMTAIAVGDKTLTFTYSSFRDVVRVASVRDANGDTTAYSMLSGYWASKTDPLGRRTQYGHSDELFTDYIVRELSAGGASVKLFETSNYDNMPLYIEVQGKTTLLAYDARGNVTKLTDATKYSTTYAYDSNDNLTGMTDALGKTWTFTYDAKSNLTRIASPLNSQTTMEYDGYGQLTGITSPAGKKTTLAYTGHGNVATVTDPLGYQTKYEYDPKGINRTAAIDRRGNKTTFTHDANNRLTRITHPDGTFRRYTYDCCALTAVIDEKGNTTTFNRDQALNLTEVTDPLGGLTEMTYDENANLVNVRDPLSRDTTSTYDGANRVVRHTDARSGSIDYTYNQYSYLTLTALADERSNQTKFTYDKNYRLASISDALNGAGRNTTIGLVRDALGRVNKIVTPSSGEILVRFDDDGRVVDKSFNANKVASFGYDGNANVVAVTDAVGSSNYTYNPRNELTGITWPDGATSTFTYDQAGNIGGIQYPGGLSASYQYDSRSRVQSVTWGGLTVGFEYDPAGNVVKATRSNGTASEYTYDAANRLIGVNHRRGTTSFAQMQYVRDAVGNIVNESGSTVIPPVFAAESIDGAFNAANQIGKWGADTYTYDNPGNLLTVTGTRALTASYDLENRLLSLSLAGTTSTYAYNGLGERASRSQGSGTTKYHYDRRGRLLFETDTSGTVIASYLYAGGSLVAMRAADGSTYFYHFDKTGNTVALTDAAGNVANAYAYEPFGKVTNQAGTVRNPFTYVGAFGVMDEGNGIYYMKHRYYDAHTGKFLQKDPIGFAGGQTNLYAYVGNNPVHRTDPTGLDWSWAKDSVYDNWRDGFIGRPPGPPETPEARAARYEDIIWGDKKWRSRYDNANVGGGLSGKMFLWALIGASVPEGDPRFTFIRGATGFSEEQFVEFQNNSSPSLELELYIAWQLLQLRNYKDHLDVTRGTGRSRACPKP